jgi:tetratricopeptide (TPR) repeat protein
LVVAVSEHDGDGPSQLRTPYGTRNYITFSLLAVKAETAKLTIGTEKGTQTVGSYQIRILEVRPSEPADAKAIQAQRLFIESEALKEGTKQDRERALENLRSAAATLQSIGRADDRGEALRQMGRVLMDLNESPKALQVLNEALALSKAQESAADEASTLNLLGEAEFNLGNTDRSHPPGPTGSSPARRSPPPPCPVCRRG